MSEIVDPKALRPGELPRSLTQGHPLSLTRYPAPHRWATRGIFAESPWREIVDLATQPELWPGAGTVAAASNRLPAWTFARYRDDTRVVTRDAALSARESRARVLDVHGLMVEYIDEPAIDAEHLLQWWGDHSFVAYTTGFHEMPWDDRPVGPRWRVLVPFSEAVDLPTAQRLADWARHPRHDVGIVAPETAEVWRAEPVCAVGPGGYRWVGCSATSLDPMRAIHQLDSWLELDTQVRAEQDLEGTSIDIAVGRFLARREAPRLRPRFPIPDVPALASSLGSLWPGRVVALLGSGGSGRTSLALQFAVASATAGLPVLVVLTRMGGDEAVARLLAMESSNTAAGLLQGEGEGVTEAAQELQSRCPSLHLWAPGGADRTLDELWKKVRAVSDAHDGRPPLVIIDGVEGWAVDDPERGARTVVAGLRDVSHAGALGPAWPGAAVLLVGLLPHNRPSPDELDALWTGGALNLGPIEPDAGAVVALSVRGDQARAVLAKNRDGPTGSWPLRFEPQATRFR